MEEVIKYEVWDYADKKYIKKEKKLDKEALLGEEITFDAKDCSQVVVYLGKYKITATANECGGLVIEENK